MPLTNLVHLRSLCVRMDVSERSLVIITALRLGTQPKSEGSMPLTNLVHLRSLRVRIDVSR